MSGGERQWKNRCSRLNINLTPGLKVYGGTLHVLLSEISHFQTGLVNQANTQKCISRLFICIENPACWVCPFQSCTELWFRCFLCGREPRTKLVWKKKKDIYKLIYWPVNSKCNRWRVARRNGSCLCPSLVQRWWRIHALWATEHIFTNVRRQICCALPARLHMQKQRLGNRHSLSLLHRIS